MYYDVKVRVRTNLNIRILAEDDARVQDICSKAIENIERNAFNCDDFEWPIKPDDILYIESVTFPPVVKPR